MTEEKFELGLTPVWDSPFEWVEEPLMWDIYGRTYTTSDWALLYPGHSPDRLVDHLEDTPDLYLKFAEIGSSATGDLKSRISNFVQSYGPLGGRFCYDEFAVRDTNGPDEGELLRHWGDQIRVYQAVFSTWMLLNDGNRAALTRRFRWMDDKIVFTTPSWLHIICSKDAQYETFTRLSSMKRGKVEATVWEFIRTTLDISMRDNIWMGIDTETISRPRTCIRAVGVCGAIWLQLARAIEGDIKLHRCVACGALFQGRSDAQCCSKKCRKRKQRKGL